MVREYGGISCLCFLERELAYFWGIKRPSFWGVESCLVLWVLEMLSAVEFGINGPPSRSDHRHGSSEDSHDDRRRRMPRVRKEDQGPKDGNGGSG